MSVILDFTGEAVLPISETAFLTQHYRHQNQEDNSYRSQNIAISAVLDMLAAILYDGDQIAKPTSRMVVQPLIIHKKVVLDNSLVHS